MGKFKILNAFQIKLLMAFLMLLDHLRYIHGLVAPETAAVLTLISRCVAPMFAYLAVEGIRRHSPCPVGKEAEDSGGEMGVCAFCGGVPLWFPLWGMGKRYSALYVY